MLRHMHQPCYSRSAPSFARCCANEYGSIARRGGTLLNGRAHRRQSPRLALGCQSQVCRTLCTPPVRLRCRRGSNVVRGSWCGVKLALRGCNPVAKYCCGLELRKLSVATPWNAACTIFSSSYFWAYGSRFSHTRTRGRARERGAGGPFDQTPQDRPLCRPRTPAARNRRPPQAVAGALGGTRRVSAPRGHNDVRAAVPC